MIEIRGVIRSPLLGFDHQSGCSAGCVTSGESILVLPVPGDITIGQLVNDDISQRPQFAAIDAYTASITGAANSMFVIMSDGVTDLHVGCSDPNPAGVQRYPQPLYNVGRLNAPSALSTPDRLRWTRASSRPPPTSPTARRSGTTRSSHPTGRCRRRRSRRARRSGVMDDIIFFIAMLPVAQDPQGQHPYLAQGVRRGDRFEVTPLADDVEDLQIAYGVDSNGDNSVTRTAPPTTYDSDLNYSNVAGDDEWRPNAPGETPFIDSEFQSAPTPLGNHSGVPPAAHCPRLHGVMLSLLAKAHDSDPTYKGPAASGYILMDVPLAAGVPITAVQGRYRRRVQTLRVNLRNYAFQG